MKNSQTRQLLRRNSRRKSAAELSISAMQKSRIRKSSHLKNYKNRIRRSKIRVLNHESKSSIDMRFQYFTHNSKSIYVIKIEVWVSRQQSSILDLIKSSTISTPIYSFNMLFISFKVFSKTFSLLALLKTRSIFFFFSLFVEYFIFRFFYSPKSILTFINESLFTLLDFLSSIFVINREFQLFNILFLKSERKSTFFSRKIGF